MNQYQKNHVLERCNMSDGITDGIRAQERYRLELLSRVEKLKELDPFYNVWSDLVDKYGSGLGKKMNHIAIEILNKLYTEHYRGRVPANMIIENDLLDLIS